MLNHRFAERFLVVAPDDSLEVPEGHYDVACQLNLSSDGTPVVLAGPGTEEAVVGSTVLGMTGPSWDNTRKSRDRDAASGGSRSGATGPKWDKTSKGRDRRADPPPLAGWTKLGTKMRDAGSERGIAFAPSGITRSAAPERPVSPSQL